MLKRVSDQESKMQVSQISATFFSRRSLEIQFDLIELCKYLNHASYKKYGILSKEKFKNQVETGILCQSLVFYLVFKIEYDFCA